jgi:hypothetical protein
MKKYFFKFLLIFAQKQTFDWISRSSKLSLILLKVNLSRLAPALGFNGSTNHSNLDPMQGLSKDPGIEVANHRTWSLELSVIVPVYLELTGWGKRQCESSLLRRGFRH